MWIRGLSDSLNIEIEMKVIYQVDTGFIVTIFIIQCNKVIVGSQFQQLVNTRTETIKFQKGYENISYRCPTSFDEMVIKKMKIQEEEDSVKLEEKD